MWELLQEILIDKLTPNQLLLLYAVDNSTSIETINPHLEIKGLVKEKLVTYKEGKSVDITKKGRDMLTKYDAYFTKAKKKTNIHLMGKEYTDMVEEYRELFPAGKLPHGKPARVNVKTLINNFRWFFENYDYTWDEVIQATRRYINEYVKKDYLYMQTSQYFISKADQSKVKQSQLADYCDMIRDGVVEEDDNHFSDKVV
jgi:predicted transcriptional regulator